MRAMPHAHGSELVKFARERVRQELGGSVAVRPEGDWTGEKAATFVTWRWRDGDLQGCIGSLIARRPIVEDVAYNSVAAALHDPRTTPLHSQSQVDQLDVELSILSPLEPIRFDGEEDALAKIRPGVDGIVFIYDGRSSTFLPVMWERIPDVRDFMSQLKMKAGLPPRFWAEGVQLERYTAEKHEDPTR
jgi:AmmeMemoRadiSam system protein A